MVLTDVQTEGAASRAGLRTGDRIVSVDGQSLRKSLRRILPEKRESGD